MTKPRNDLIVNYKVAVQELCKLHLQKFLVREIADHPSIRIFHIVFAKLFCRFAFSFFSICSILKVQLEGTVPSELNNVSGQLQEGLT